MTREAQIRQTADKWLGYYHPACTQDMLVEAFRCGAEWADQHQPSPWISVEDRLPEDGDFVFAMSQTKNDSGIVRGISASKYTDGKFINENKYSFSDSNGVFFDLSNKMVLFNITHWMPIPELTKKTTNN